jgi:hypothetical protein
VDDEDYRVDSTFRLEPVAQLANIVSGLRGGSATGTDNIPASLVKECFNFIKQPLLNIINGSVRTGVFPEVFKVGKVIPIFKGDPKDK